MRANEKKLVLEPANRVVRGEELHLRLSKLRRKSSEFVVLVRETEGAHQRRREQSGFELVNNLEDFRAYAIALHSSGLKLDGYRNGFWRF